MIIGAVSLAVSVALRMLVAFVPPDVVVVAPVVALGVANEDGSTMADVTIGAGATLMGVLGSMRSTNGALGVLNDELLAEIGDDTGASGSMAGESEMADVGSLMLPVTSLSGFAGTDCFASTTGAAALDLTRVGGAEVAALPGAASPALVDG